MQDNSSAQTNDIPKAAPAEAIVVMLPVPIFKPIRNIPGAIVAKKIISFFHQPTLGSLAEIFTKSSKFQRF